MRVPLIESVPYDTPCAEVARFGSLESYPGYIFVFRLIPAVITQSPVRRSANVMLRLSFGVILNGMPCEGIDRIVNQS